MSETNRCATCYSAVSGEHRKGCTAPAEPSERMGDEPTDEEVGNAYCLAHSHRNRWAEAVCSLRFQRDAARAEVALRIKDSWAVRKLENCKGLLTSSIERADAAEAEVERLRAALTEIVDLASRVCGRNCVYAGIAAAALKEPKP